MGWLPSEAEKQAAWQDPVSVNSIDWGVMWPEHCYICHIASDRYERDEGSDCGPHCDGVMKEDREH